MASSCGSVASLRRRCSESEPESVASLVCAQPVANAYQPLAVPMANALHDQPLAVPWQVGSGLYSGGEDLGKVQKKTLGEVRTALEQRLRGTGNCWNKKCKMRCRLRARQRVQELASVMYPLENTTKLHKDQMLGELLGGARRKGPRRCLGSLSVCWRAHRAILGIGAGRAGRRRKNRMDGRFGRRAVGDPRGRPRAAQSRMYSHLWHVYWSLGETLPEEPVLLDSSDPLTPAPGSARASLRAFSTAVHKSGPSGPGTEGLLLEPHEDLPTRWLPPGSMRDHFWTYKVSATESGQPAPGSYSTLCRVWKTYFGRVLKIRPEYGKHPGCTTCRRLKEGIHTCVSYADKIDASKKLSEHFEQTWRDRLVYWRLRSHASHTGSKWIVVILDGADQAKFRIMKSIVWPKNLEAEHRPQMKCVGSWAHGWELSFSFAEEDVPHGSNVTIECLVRTLDRVLQLHMSAALGTDNATPAAPGTGFPANLWLQVDNAGGENKNIWISKFLAQLVDQGIFRSAVASYLAVGHTHEDLDGLFGIMSSHIRKMMEWDSPMQMAESPS